MKSQNKKLAPVALFVYARADHTSQTIEALSKNTLAKDTEIWIFSDGPKNNKVEKKVREVREYINLVKEKEWFKNVQIIESQLNKGLAKSIMDGVSHILEKRKNVIVIEDDLITAPDYLEFMNKGLSFYETSQNIGSITGYSPLKSIPDDYSHDIYIVQRSCSYGWATWKDRWVNVDWKASAYHLLKKDFQLRNKFNECGMDRYNRLERQMKGQIDSWSIRFGLWQFINDLYTVYPVVSRLKNIGWDGSGTHSSKNIKIPYNQEIANNKTPFQLEHVQKNEKITRAIRRIYSGTLKTKVARTIENYLLLFTK